MQTTRTRHSKLSLALWLTLAGAALSACSSFEPRPLTPISAITSAAEAGASSNTILSQFRTAKTVYALRGSDFPKLAQRGVEEPVLDELQQSFFSEVELLTKRWYQERHSGGPASFYPQPVDLDNLDSGGNGMAPTTNLGRTTHSTRPPGVPDWVPAYPNVTGPEISAEAVLEMTRGGMPAEQIVERVQRSRVKILYADPKNAISRTRTAAITGSTYARLAEQGVALEVLDALQATYLADHIERSRLRWRDMGTKGSTTVP